MASGRFIHRNLPGPGRLWRALRCTDLPAKLSETCRRMSSQTGSSRGVWPGLVYAVIRSGMS